ncbi:MAG: carboxymuconolactone decarboxylase family protein [Porticoccaceae bacterium]
MRMQTPRVPPVQPEDWSDEQRAIFGEVKMGGRILNIFKTLANHPQLGKRWLVFANHIMGKSKISLREREILILRIGWLCKSGYEWGQHVVIGRECDLSDAEMERIKLGADAEGWTEQEALLLKATDELHADAFISNPTWAGLSKSYNTQQLMDVVFTVGQYNLVSMALNTLGVQLDEGMELDPELVRRA